VNRECITDGRAARHPDADRAIFAWRARAGVRTICHIGCGLTDVSFVISRII
jgi:hypothetical protein